METLFVLVIAGVLASFTTVAVIGLCVAWIVYRASKQDARAGVGLNDVEVELERARRELAKRQDAAGKRAAGDAPGQDKPLRRAELRRDAALGTSGTLRWPDVIATLLQLDAPRPESAPAMLRSNRPKKICRPCAFLRAWVKR